MTRTDDMDTLLAAYADGELDEAAVREVEAYIAFHPAAQRLLEVQRETSALLRTAFGEVLFQRPSEPPVLLPGTQRAPARRPNVRWRTYGAVIAASLLLMLGGYGVGAYWPDLLLAQRSRMLSEIAEYHAVYSRETVHLVEVPAAQSDHLKQWLGRRVKATLVIPDFRESGLTFAGGRMVVLDGEPVAELMYTREKGLPIAFCVVYRAGSATQLQVARRGDLHLASWEDGSHLYVVVGEAAPKVIEGLATVARRQL